MAITTWPNEAVEQIVRRCTEVRHCCLFARAMLAIQLFGPGNGNDKIWNCNERFKTGSFCKNLLFGSGNANNKISSFNAICIFSASFFCNVDSGPRNAMNKLGMSVSWFLTNSIGKFYCNSAKIQHTFPPGRSQISSKSLVERMSSLKRTRLTWRLKVKQIICIGPR